MMKEIIRKTLAPSGYWAPFGFWLLFEMIFLSLVGIIASVFNLSYVTIGISLTVGFVVSFSMIFFQCSVAEGIERKDIEFWKKMEKLIDKKINRTK